jgi:hypothetical protein
MPEASASSELSTVPLVDLNQVRFNGLASFSTRRWRWPIEPAVSAASPAPLNSGTLKSSSKPWPTLTSKELSARDAERVQILQRLAERAILTLAWLRSLSAI